MSGAIEDFDIETDGAKTAGRMYASPGAKATLILAHGAGSTQSHPWMVAFAKALVAVKLEIVTFDFLYAHQKRRAPDRNEVLEETWRAAARTVILRGLAAGRLFVGGKSMGGRIATQVAAQEGFSALRGLVLLGYPLHPPGKPTVLRTAHFPRLRWPMLFVQGSRDTFGTPAELANALKAVPGRTRLYEVEGGDHSLSPPKRGNSTLAAVMAQVAAEIDAFVTSTSG